jgi:hypothetical protein
MSLPLTDLVAGIFKPAADLIDSLHTSEDERLSQKAHLLNVQANVIQQAIDYEKETFKAQTDIIRAEAQSEHWITATWRPITMLVFLGLAVLDSFGVIEALSGRALAEEAWALLQLGIGGYVVARSGEKITKSIIESRVTGK